MSQFQDRILHFIWTRLNVNIFIIESTFPKFSLVLLMVGTMNRNYFLYTMTFLMGAIHCSHEMCLDIHDMTVCVGNKFIKGIPEKVDGNMTKICFMHGENSEIPKNAFILLTRMEALYLNLTNIFTIAVGAFNRLDNLTTLGFYGNRISRVEKSIFRPVPNLVTLDLSGNDINKISNIKFAGLPNLENLLLVHNFIRTIEKKNFESLLKLKFLDLSLNYIQSIDDDTFSNLISLENLNLNYNKIASVEDRAFDGLKRLTSLKLRGNYLQCVPTQKFSSSVGLIIDLQDNKADCKEIQSELDIKNNVTIICE